MKVLFICNHDGSPKGGHGNDPATYGVIHDGKELGICVKHDDWKYYLKEDAIIDGKPFSYARQPLIKSQTLSSLKERVTAFYAV